MHISYDRFHANFNFLIPCKFHVTYYTFHITYYTLHIHFIYRASNAGLRASSSCPLPEHTEPGAKAIEAASPLLLPPGPRQEEQVASA
jgi:hypothetical protein